ncbi:hypothetical protein CAOG_09087 [Capsaspora owczarzaki ATCC 30864]|uniref:Uncharacterized protein n=1 Tax=Capsaspora owczarzaki (strain ATCC 30864) TaxID=595528 RepID=A0A0D2URH8_CAPO3|nr:hypothetical protein CAOG_09087 [Capsaspora owczarzaki ATCC 30864]KJE97581.1 hypothetical protein CAOG_009087 [Capsaspora owczarzaki ATCC 30864]|eukprot:XP_011270820.1 hypothetical protein CAOG_09087 [Capsaspora owczarzaki ATCC 30864]
MSFRGLSLLRAPVLLSRAVRAPIALLYSSGSVSTRRAASGSATTPPVSNQTISRAAFTEYITARRLLDASHAAPLLETAAAHGHTDALHILALDMFKVESRESLFRGYQLLKASADLGHALSLYLLGCSHLEGRYNIPVDYELGYSMIQAAADRNLPQAMYHVAVKLLAESAQPPDEARALSMLRKASKIRSDALERIRCVLGLHLLRKWYTTPEEERTMLEMDALNEALPLLHALKHGGGPTAFVAAAWLEHIEEDLLALDD